MHAIGAEYMDFRDKCKQMAPDRAFEKGASSLWHLQKTCDGDLFQRSVRQELYDVDLDLLKYMRKLERGTFKPTSGKERTLSNMDKTKDQLKHDLVLHHSYKTKYMALNAKKWDPPTFLPNLLHNTVPLLDNTNTPRKAKRAITLDRSFDREPWMYNRF